MIYDGDFKIYIDKTGKELLNEVDLTLERSLLFGEYLALRNVGRKFC